MALERSLFNIVSLALKRTSSVIIPLLTTYLINDAKGYYAKSAQDEHHSSAQNKYRNPRLTHSLAQTKTPTILSIYSKTYRLNQENQPYLNLNSIHVRFFQQH